MLVDFRPHARLRSKDPVDTATALVPVVEALSGDSVDLSRVRIVCDWVQYRENFRDVVALRPILTCPQQVPHGGPVVVPRGTRDDDMEIAVDVRRSTDVPLKDLTAALLRELGGQRTADRVLLEDWGPGSESCIWQFNARYWTDLELWERSTGRGYEQALPGGESDARDRGAVRELIRGLFTVWDGLAAAGALPEQLCIVELGVGNGHQAEVFLDEFQALDLAHGAGYYRRLHYLMCDYSAHVLDLARATVGAHLDRVSSVTLDATQPLTSLGFLQYKVFLVYVSNVYDNLPTDEVAQLGGRTHIVQTRAYLNTPDAADIARSVHTDTGALPALVHKLLRLGPTLLAEVAPAHFPDVAAAVTFWRRVWSAVRLEERYAPLAGLDLYAITASLSGEMLRPLLESGADVRMHVNNGALASFTDSLRLLHPFGRLVCHDLFVTDVAAYRAGFLGPGKYDGSVVNWVNGALLSHVGRRHGFDVRYAPFTGRAGGHIVTMTAQVRD